MAGGSLTRSDIEAWSTEHLDTAATHWTSTAQAWEEHFTTIHNGMLRPGGTTWEGAGADAAAERSWADLVTVRGVADALHSASGHATNGSGDVAWAKRQALNAIAEAEEDGFTVGQDFSVKDTSMPSLLLGSEDRQSKAKEHAHAIQAAVQQLVDADKQAADRTQGALSPLNGLTFPGQDGGQHDPTVKAVDYHPGEKSGDNSDGNSGEKPSGSTDPNGLAALLLPPEKPGGATPPKLGEKPPANAMDLIEQARRDAAAKPADSKTSDSSGLGSLLGTDDSLERKPGDPAATGLPPVLSQLSPAPDRATIDRQQAKVAAAEQTLTAAQAKADASARDAIVLGPGAGPSRDSTDALGQAVFDARRDLTEQRQILVELNASAAAHGDLQVSVPQLPENAEVQASTPVPRESFMDAQRWSNHTVHELTGGLVPDLFQDHHTATHWSEATPAERAQLIADAAGMVPLPGMKVGAEGLEHLAGPAVEALAHDAPSVVAHGAPPVVAHELHGGGEQGGTAHAGDIPVSGDHGVIGHGGDVAPVQLDLTTDHARALGMDPATGGFRAAESETGLRVERELGVDLSRAGRGDAHDWVDAGGRTYDAVGNFPSKFFDSQWPNLQGRILDHLEKAEIVPVDVSQTAAQREVVREFVQGLRNPNVVIVGGK